MAEYSLIDAYRMAVREKIREKEAALGHGGASSWEDYKRKNGMIEGYEDALSIFSELIRKYIDEEDVDD